MDLIHVATDFSADRLARTECANCAVLVLLFRDYPCISLAAVAPWTLIGLGMS